MLVRPARPKREASDKRGRQAEEEVLLGLISLWDSGSSRQVSIGQTDCSHGSL